MRARMLCVYVCVSACWEPIATEFGGKRDLACGADAGLSCFHEVSSRSPVHAAPACFQMSPSRDSRTCQDGKS